MLKLIVAGFILAHAAIHLSFVSPRPPATAGGPPWPFDIGQSPLLSALGAPSEVTRLLGIALVAVTVAGFVLAALSALGLAAAGLWTAGVIIGSVASIGLLGIFFHPWLVLGIAIDVVLVWAVTIARWQPA